jgi:peptidoglycan/xylan/chitin deacetylase (PgdA/CDA1 family)
MSSPGSPTPLPAGPTDTPDDIRGDYQPRAVTVPILLYHHILADTPLVRYTVAAQRFEQQLDYLIAHGYQTITLQDLLDAIRAGATLPDHPVVLAFDDGNQEVLELAYPRMQARGMVGVVYVVGNRIGVEGFLDAEGLQTLREAGWEIGSHGMTHRSLEDLSAEDLAREVVLSKAVIETALGEPIHSFAYPFGTVTEASLLAVMRAGYTSGAGLGISNLHRPNDLFYLSRREVRGTYELQAFAALLEGL